MSRRVTLLMSPTKFYLYHFRNNIFNDPLRRFTPSQSWTKRIYVDVKTLTMKIEYSLLSTAILGSSKYLKRPQFTGDWLIALNSTQPSIPICILEYTPAIFVLFQIKAINARSNRTITILSNHPQPLISS